MFSALLALLTLPYLDLSISRGIQFKPISKAAFFIFLSNFIVLMILGAKHVESPFIEFGMISTFIFFSYFILATPVISVFENILLNMEPLENILINKEPVENTIAKPRNN